MTRGRSAELTMPTGQRLERVLGVAVLAGAVSGSSLARLIGRSALDLPLADGAPVAAQWIAAAGTLSEVGGSTSVWVLVDDASPAPATDVPGLEVLRDRGGLRGAGGALRDLAADLDPDGKILVVTGAHALLEPLAPIVQSLSEVGADIAMLGERAHRQEDGRTGNAMLASCSMMLASCEALSTMRAVGFVDLKEQGLRQLRGGYDIRVVGQSQKATAPLRTREEYIRAVRALALRAEGLPDDSDDPLAERWRPAFSIADGSAQIAPGSKVCDSVVLGGASVGAGATVVRSVVAGHVAPGDTVVDAVIEPGGQKEAS